MFLLSQDAFIDFFSRSTNLCSCYKFSKLAMYQSSLKAVVHPVNLYVRNRKICPLLMIKQPSSILLKTACKKITTSHL